MSAQQKTSLGVLTSGGDAPGMNAAVRAVVRTALNLGLDVYAIYEGYQGMVIGDNYIRQMTWDAVGGILQRGGDFWRDGQSGFEIPQGFCALSPPEISFRARC